MERFFETTITYIQGGGKETTRCKTVDASPEAIDQFIYGRLESGVGIGGEEKPHECSVREIDGQTYMSGRHDDTSVELIVRPEGDESFDPFTMEFYISEHADTESKNAWLDVLEVRRVMSEEGGCDE